MKNAIYLSLTALLLLNTIGVLAQERDADGNNDFSVRPIHENDQLHKRTMWWRIYGDEKMNKPLFARNNEITKVIIEAVKSGILRPFENDSLKTRMAYERFMENLKMASTEPEGDEYIFETEEGWPDLIETTEKTVAAVDEYMPHQIKIIEMREDVIFDKKQSRIVHDIQSISIVLSAKYTPTGLEKTIASFSYKELVENVFKDNPNAIWYNSNNVKEHRNLTEAFELRLFAAHLIKYANAEDNDIEMIYGTDANAGNPQMAAIVASKQIEHSLLEWEDTLWEY